jgi:hypothetical protein
MLAGRPAALELPADVSPQVTEGAASNAVAWFLLHPPAGKAGDAEPEGPRASALTLPASFP